MSEKSNKNQQAEIWTRTPGYSDYRISMSGVVKRIKTAIGRGGVGGNRWKAGKIKKPSSNGKYYKTSLYGKRGEKQIYIHRLVLFSFTGPPPKGYECNHKDGDRLNNRLDNLEWISHFDNVQHAVKNGLKKNFVNVPMPGEKHPMHKLKNGEVWLIKKLLHSGKISQSKIGKMFKIAQSTVSKINLGIRWRHIEYNHDLLNGVCNGIF